MDKKIQKITSIVPVIEVAVEPGPQSIFGGLCSKCNGSYRTVRVLTGRWAGASLCGECWCMISFVEREGN